MEIFHPTSTWLFGGDLQKVPGTEAGRQAPENPPGISRLRFTTDRKKQLIQFLIGWYGVDGVDGDSFGDPDFQRCKT